MTAEERIDVGTKYIIPDLILSQKDSNKFIIEIKVTHETGKNKISLIGEIGFPAIEIKIGKNPGSFSSLQRILINSLMYKHLLYNPLQ